MTAPNTHILAPEAAWAYILAGHGKATIVGFNSRHTYSFSVPPKEAPDALRQGNPVFVRVLTGAHDDHNAWLYIGMIGTRDQPRGMIAGKRGNAEHPAFKAFAWYINKAQTNPTAAARAEFWHEGVCGCCGRTLTDPQSISLGIGPTCRGKPAMMKEAA